MGLLMVSWAMLSKMAELLCCLQDSSTSVFKADRSGSGDVALMASANTLPMSGPEVGAGTPCCC